jgi:hypothetical protein
MVSVPGTGRNLTRITATGWRTFPEGIVCVDSCEEMTDIDSSVCAANCFHKPPPIARCNEFYKTTRPGWDGSSFSALTASGVEDVLRKHKVSVESVRKRDDHCTCLAKKWKECDTHEIGEVVYDLYRTDFLFFRYDKADFVVQKRRRMP